jgi:uncharacterized protein GlcG (DUF336 family)
MRRRLRLRLKPLRHCVLACLLLHGCGGSGEDKPGVLKGVGDEALTETVHLTAADVQTIISQAATQATLSGLPVTIAVVDHEGVVLGILRMAGAAVNTTIAGGGTGGLEGVTGGLVTAANAAVSKAGTGAFFSTQRNAFTTRTASFIVQEHFPPQVSPSPGGPLFGVQFSNLRCSDVNRGPGVHAAAVSGLPLGLSADPGGLPLYKNGVAVGGIGVEGDGVYTADLGQPDASPTTEETIAAAGTLNFAAAQGIRGNNIFVDGIRLLFANADPPGSQTTTPYATFVAGGGVEVVTPIPSPPTDFVARTLNGISGTVPPQFAAGFLAGTTPAPGGLTVADVTRILAQAGAQADATRAAIRLPVGSPARVTISVVDTSGNILGIFRTLDAPIFGFDVSAQKARTAAFFSSATAAAELNAAAGLAQYASAAASDGLALNGSIAFSSRAIGFLSQPIYPPGAIPPFSNGPFSKPLGTWSIFNTGLQLDLIAGQLGIAGTGCNPGAIPELKNGITIFPGGFPLYKNGVLVGAIGISGDGVDQDDLIGFVGSSGFEAPTSIRADTLSIRGTNLPYVVLPRNPNL